jgi:hypothetical protein
VVAIPNPWPLKAQFRPDDRWRCASGSRSGDADSAARLYQVTGLIAQSSSTTGECRFWVDAVEKSSFLLVVAVFRLRCTAAIEAILIWVEFDAN